MLTDHVTSSGTVQHLAAAAAYVQRGTPLVVFHETLQSYVPAQAYFIHSFIHLYSLLRIKSAQSVKTVKTRKRSLRHG